MGRKKKMSQRDIKTIIVICFLPIVLCYYLIVAIFKMIELVFHNDTSEKVKPTNNSSIDSGLQNTLGYNSNTPLYNKYIQMKSKHVNKNSLNDTSDKQNHNKKSKT